MSGRACSGRFQTCCAFAKTKAGRFFYVCAKEGRLISAGRSGSQEPSLEPATQESLSTVWQTNNHSNSSIIQTTKLFDQQNYSNSKTIRTTKLFEQQNHLNNKLKNSE